MRVVVLTPHGSKMVRFRYRMNTRTASKLIVPCLVSCFFVVFTHIALSRVPRLFPSSSLITLFALSALVLLALAGLKKLCRRLLGVKASAPAFVLFNIFFVWGVYVTVVRQAVTSLMDIIINVEFSMVIIGLYRILLSDPGLVKHEILHKDEPTGATDVILETQHKMGLGPLASDVNPECMIRESSVSYKRVRYCGRCKAYIRGFDHHCPAFGNCIGENNHILFVALLVGFVIDEISYIVCCSQFAGETLILYTTGSENTLRRDLVVSTTVFSTLQVPWQVFFLAWHIYCVCVNIRTEEWINWKKYPEFQLTVHSQQFLPGGFFPSVSLSKFIFYWFFWVPGQNSSKTVFRNPYNRGVLLNIKEFLVPVC